MSGLTKNGVGSGNLRSQTMRWLLVAGIAVLGLLAGGYTFAGLTSSAQATTYYIDYAKGSDANTGDRPDAPWKHAPGDSEASGRVAQAKLVGGDVVRFHGGVAYRGQIRARWSGTPGKPIQYVGIGYGAGAAVIDGADPVTVRPCPSMSACGMAPDWQQLSQVSFSEPVSGFVQLYDGLGVLSESRYPTLDDPLYPDDISQWATTSKASAADIQNGKLESSAAAAYLGGRASGEIGIWVRGNDFLRRKITGVVGSTISFDATGVQPYLDRDGRIAIFGATSSGLRPRNFAKVGPGLAVARLSPQGGNVLIGAARGGFDLAGSSELTVSGFTFAHQTSGLGQSGSIAISSLAKGPSVHVKISDNEFSNSVMWNKQGAVVYAHTDGYTVTKNRFLNILGGSGVRLASDNHGTIISDNSFSGLGRTAIAFFGVLDSQITGNTLRNLKGLHGNGISLYLANRRILVDHNCILDTTRPMTINGEGPVPKAPGDHDFVITNNVFIATADSQAALTSWGAYARGVIIRGNTLLGGKAGLLLNGKDSGVKATGNRLSGLLTLGTVAPDWEISGNSTVPFSTAPTGSGLGWCR